MADAITQRMHRNVQRDVANRVADEAMYGYDDDRQQTSPYYRDEHDQRRRRHRGGGGGFDVHTSGGNTAAFIGGAIAITALIAGGVYAVYNAVKNSRVTIIRHNDNGNIVSVGRRVLGQSDKNSSIVAAGGGDEQALAFMKSMQQRATTGSDITTAVVDNLNLVSNKGILTSNIITAVNDAGGFNATPTSDSVVTGMGRIIPINSDNQPGPYTGKFGELMTKICPPPAQILAVGTTGVFHCYAPCDIGFRTVIIDPRQGTDAFSEMQYSADGGVLTDENKDKLDSDPAFREFGPYLGCQANCPPYMKDANGACTRHIISRWTADRIGLGVDNVKCPLTLSGMNVFYGWNSGGIYKHTTQKNTLTANCQHDDEWRKDYECLPLQGDLNGRLTVAWPRDNVERAATNNKWIGSQRYRPDWWTKGTDIVLDKNVALCSFWGNSHHKTDVQLGTFTFFHPWSASACGNDYELRPTRPAAYFGDWHGQGSMSGPFGDEEFDGRDVMKTWKGLVCSKMCPSWQPMIPDGTWELVGAFCAEPCPINTRENDIRPSECIKDGYKRPILVDNMQFIVDPEETVRKMEEARKKAGGSAL